MILNTLKTGSNGKDIKELQGMLNKVLSLTPSLKVDGDFGKKTKDFVLKFQKKVKITEDGVVGVITWTELSKLHTDIIKKNTRQNINQKHGVVERMKWGVKHPKTNKLVPDWNYMAIAIHHSGNGGKKDPREIEVKHMVDNGYDDVGYHYLIHPGGTIYEGRKIYHKGSHVIKANTGKIGILLMGDFDEQWWDFDDRLSKSHISSANALIKTLRAVFPGIRTLGGHKEFLPGKGYTCPGNQIMAKLDKMRIKHGLIKP